MKFGKVYIKNFLSIGNVEQEVDLDDQNLHMILGLNLDQGGEDNRNGAGKTTIINALSFVLFGKPIVNIKLDNLINKTNAKKMLVTLEFSVGEDEYKIIRGRKPGILKLYKNDHEMEEDQAVSENKLTQIELESIYGFGFTMFKHIIALNTTTEPFLSMGIGDQREVIEQLLGITQISEKASELREIVKITKMHIEQETFKIESIKEANLRIEDNIRKIERMSDIWQKQHDNKIVDLREQLEELKVVDIETELLAHKENENLSKLVNLIETDRKNLAFLEKNARNKKQSLAATISKIEKTHAKECHTCGHELNTDEVASILKKLEESKKDYEETILELEEGIEVLLNSIGKYTEQLEGHEEIPTFYKTKEDAYAHKTTLEHVHKAIEDLEATENPHTESIGNLSEKGIQEIDYTKVNELYDLKDHQDFLLKLLTNKDSFIRIKIINQNLKYLNIRLQKYLREIGLPHQVKFIPDLSVEIHEHGRELDFHNLSRGEKTRLTLALSWAFRDVFESINGVRTNLLLIDELLDNGLDTSGVDACLKTLKSFVREDRRNIFLISHREELIPRVHSVVNVIKENGFTRIEKAEI